jgi:hypothetical protein
MEIQIFLSENEILPTAKEMRKEKREWLRALAREAQESRK